MKTELDKLIEKAYESNGATGDVNDVYLTLLKTQLLVPAELHPEATEDEEPFTPLFSTEGEFIFMAAFDSEEKLQNWLTQAEAESDYVMLKGKDLINGIGEKVFLALNPGSEFYKEFTPDEIQRLKTIIAKVASLTSK